MPAGTNLCTLLKNTKNSFLFFKMHLCHLDRDLLLELPRIPSSLLTGLRCLLDELSSSTLLDELDVTLEDELEDDELLLLESLSSGFFIFCLSFSMR